MTMSTLNRRTLTGTTLLVLAVLFLALVVLSSVLLRGARIDLTSNRLYTLSAGTEAILGKIEEPITLYYYYSDQAARDIPQLRTYATRVRELLEEIAAKSGGKVRLEIIDPLPFSEQEDRATAAGLQAVPLGNSGETLFFGLVGTNSTDGEASIPFFQPDKEAFLEYDVAKVISSLSNDELPIVGLLAGLNMGQGFNPQTSSVTPGWVVDAELRKLFDIQRIEPTATEIPAEVQALVLVHPKNLSDDMLYAVDQFVLRGGRLLVFVDPHAEAEQAGQGADPAMAMFADKSSDLARLFKTWGVEYDPQRVVLDGRHALELQTSPDRPPVRHLAVLGLVGGKGDDTALNAGDVISAELEQINVSTVGHFDLAEDASAKLETLAQSSAAAMTIPADRVRSLPDPETLFAGFTPSGERYTLAARLTGPLKTAFPERSGEKHLAESVEPANIVLVADTDLLTDRLWVQVTQFFGQRVINAFANNGDFTINAVDNLIGSGDLISVRTRPGSVRPFDTVDDLKRAADDRFRAKEQELQAELAETERKLTELQGAKGEGNAMILSPEQQSALLRFQDEKLRIRKELRQVRAQLDADIRSLGAKLKFINIAGVPLLLTFGALIWVFLRNRARRGEVAR
jgi:ABC-type uncharacterized transport system involved in gliding motility auxiliary subunit